MIIDTITFYYTLQDNVSEDSLLSFVIHRYYYITYTAAQKFGISKIFNVFRGVSSAHQGCIYSIKNTVIL